MRTSRWPTVDVLMNIYFVGYIELFCLLRRWLVAIPDSISPWRRHEHCYYIHLNLYHISEQSGIRWRVHNFALIIPIHKSRLKRVNLKVSLNILWLLRLKSLDDLAETEALFLSHCFQALSLSLIKEPTDRVSNKVGQLLLESINCSRTRSIGWRL